MHVNALQAEHVKVTKDNGSMRLTGSTWKPGGSGGFEAQPV